MEDLGLKLLGILGAAFLFGFAIFIHELGHFLAAKFFGIGVNKFAIGFGPKIWSFVKGGTEYSFRWIPLGGFVALKGMVDEEEEGTGKREEGIEDKGKSGNAPLVPSPHIPSSPEPPASVKAAASDEAKKKAKITEDLDALRNRHPLVKMIVFTSGVACNYLTAIVLMGVLMWYGIPKFQPLPSIIAEVPPASEFYKQGWRSGDRVISVEGRKVDDWEEFEAVLVGKEDQKGLFDAKDLKAENPPAETVDVAVQRNGETVSLPLSPAMIKKDPETFGPILPAVIGAVEPNSAADKARLVKENYVPGKPAQPIPDLAQLPKEPLQAEDRVLAVNDKMVQSWQEMKKILEVHPNKPITLTVKRADGESTKVLQLATVLESNKAEKPKGLLGVYPGMIEIKGERDRKPFLEAFATAPLMTVKQTVRLVVLQVEFIKNATWQQTQRNLGGPVAISVMAYRSAQKGLVDYLNLFIAISIILAVMNILPIPVLDGGYIAITFIEMVIRRPIPQRVLAPILTTFMFLFIILFTLLFYNDFRNWIFKQ